MNTLLKIYTDGGSRGNPGPAACAFVAILDGSLIFKKAQYLGKATNNEAEYGAVILALRWVVDNKDKYSFKRIVFILDSELVARQLVGLYKVKSDNLKVIARKIRNVQDSLKDMEISFVSVKRENNVLADRMVNEKLDEKSREFHVRKVS